MGEVVETDLAAWLLRQIDADEQCATAAGHGFGHLPLITELNGGWTELDLSRNVRPTYDQRFAKLFDPQQRLVECDTKRRIIELHRPEPFMDVPDEACCTHCQKTAGIYPCETVRLLALPYRERPGYVDSWAPDGR